MTSQIPSPIAEEFVAEVTDLAYRALLRQGLRGSFLDAELSLWAQIRSAFQTRWVKDPRGEQSLIVERSKPSHTLDVGGVADTWVFTARSDSSGGAL
jgi:hypothetical protein